MEVTYAGLCKLGEEKLAEIILRTHQSFEVGYKSHAKRLEKSKEDITSTIDKMLGNDGGLGLFECAAESAHVDYAVMRELEFQREYLEDGIRQLADE